MRLSPVQFYDDFLGADNGAGFPNEYIAGENTTAIWRTVETNLNADIAVVNDAANGIVRIAADVDDNAEEGTIFFNDNLQFRLDQGLIFECRVAMSVLPTNVGGELTSIIFGLASANAALPDDVAVNAWFRLEGTADILWETDDATTDDDDNDTLENAGAGVYDTYRIDCTDWTTPKFYINGALVGTGNMAGLIAPEVQPFFRVDKQWAAANTSLGALDIDYVRVWQNRTE